MGGAWRPSIRFDPHWLLYLGSDRERKGGSSAAYIHSRLGTDTAGGCWSSHWSSDLVRTVAALLTRGIARWFSGYNVPWRCGGVRCALVLDGFSCGASVISWSYQPFVSAIRRSESRMVGSSLRMVRSR